jgi:hypothetical protein
VCGYSAAPFIYEAVEKIDYSQRQTLANLRCRKPDFPTDEFIAHTLRLGVVDRTYNTEWEFPTFSTEDDGQLAVDRD